MMSRVLCFVALLVVATQAFVPTVSRGGKLVDPKKAEVFFFRRTK